MNKISTTGIYVSPMGIEVHQMYYYYHFLEFLPSGKFILKMFIVEKGQPKQPSYSNLIAHGFEVGTGDYILKNDIFHAEIVDHTVFTGTVNHNNISLEIKSINQFLFSATYEFIEV